MLLHTIAKLLARIILAFKRPKFQSEFKEDYIKFMETFMLCTFIVQGCISNVLLLPAILFGINSRTAEGGVSATN